MYSNYVALLRNMQEEEEEEKVSLLKHYTDADLEQEYQAYLSLLKRLQQDLVLRSDFEHRQRLLKKRQKHMENSLNFCTVI